MKKTGYKKSRETVPLNVKKFHYIKVNILKSNNPLTIFSQKNVFPQKLHFSKNAMDTLLKKFRFFCYFERIALKSSESLVNLKSNALKCNKC